MALTLFSWGNDKTPLRAVSQRSPSELLPRRKAYGPLVALLGVCVLVLIGRPTWSSYPRYPAVNERRFQVPSDRKVLGSVETAGVSRRVIGRVNGKIVLVGWAAFTGPQSSLSGIAILVDGVQRAETNSFFDRPDIAASFGRLDFELSGWEVFLPLSGLRPGKYNLTVEAFTETGASASLHPVQLQVIE